MAKSENELPKGLGRTAPEKTTRKRENRDLVRIAAAVVIVALLIGFVLDNSRTVKVGFIVFSSSVPLIWVLLITALLGVVVDRLFMWKRSQHRRAEAKSQDR